MAGSELQKRFIQPSFRGVKFYCETANLTFGRRTANHEFPQYDKPYSEDMGKLQDAIKLEAWVSGDDWEKQRDALLEACKEFGPGKLVHPDLGEMLVQVGSCEYTESKQTAARKATFSLVFYETTEAGFPSVQVNTISAIQDAATSGKFKLADAFKALYKLTQLPQYATDYVMGFIGDMTGIYNPYSLLAVSNAIGDLMDGDITLPWQLPVLASAFSASYNNDYSNKGSIIKYENEKYVQVIPDETLQTNTIDARIALNTYLDIVNVQLQHLTPYTNSQKEQLEAGKRVELLIKANCVIEAGVAASQIDYTSINEAQVVWTRILTAYDKVITLSTDLNDNNSYIELRKQRGLFQADIQERAPNLAVIVYRDYLDPQPMLTIAYDVYEDISRHDEIVKRNKIRHPLFSARRRMELLNV
jgi:prophage DNA circulation protein